MERNIKQVQPQVATIPARKRVAAYARVSSEKMSMVESLSAQVSYYSGYIQRHPEWEYAGVYADEGFTGTKANRPEFQRLLDDCRAGCIDIVLTKSVSRFARNTLTLLNIIRELKELGIDVFFERENMHSTSGDGELLLSILASFAQEESRSVSENCKWRIQNRMKSGEIVGLRDMYGYEIDHDGIRIQPEQAKVVQRVFDEYVTNGLSSAKIAKILRAEAIPALLGGTWTAKRIRDMLRNEKYTGDALLQKRYVVDHLTKRRAMNRGELPQYYVKETLPAIIDMETFQRAQEILAERGDQNKASKPLDTRYPFSGLIRCGNCGRTYRRKTCHGKVAWQCETYMTDGKAACPAKQVPEDTLIRSAMIATGTPTFDAAALGRQIKRITVSGPNSLRFEYKDGRFVELGWKDRSRRESWTAEMREAARQKSKERVDR